MAAVGRVVTEAVVTAAEGMGRGIESEEEKGVKESQGEETTGGTYGYCGWARGLSGEGRQWWRGISVCTPTSAHAAAMRARERGTLEGKRKQQQAGNQAAAARRRRRDETRPTAAGERAGSRRWASGRVGERVGEG